MDALKPDPPSNLPAYVTDPLARQDQNALETIQDYVDELLAYRSAVEAQTGDEELADANEELITVEKDSAGSIVVKKVPCGKDCEGCPHGPYKYRVIRDGETLAWEYLGAVEA